MRDLFISIRLAGVMNLADGGDEGEQTQECDLVVRIKESLMRLRRWHWAETFVVGTV